MMSTEAEAYIAKRQAENREDCRSCGMTDKTCTARILGKKQSACCALCAATEMHPRRPGPVEPTDEFMRGVLAERTRIAAYLTELLMVTRNDGPAQGHLSNTCWTRHPRCTLVAVRKFVGPVPEPESDLPK